MEEVTLADAAAAVQTFLDDEDDGTTTSTDPEDVMENAEVYVFDQYPVIPDDEMLTVDKKTGEAQREVWNDGPRFAGLKPVSVG